MLPKIIRIYFPDHNVRLIAINDLVDSDEGENEIAPFKNVMNEMYARDISRKVRSAHRIRGTSGEPLSQPPYGYMKSPENKKKWIHYKFVGYLELPSLGSRRNYREETRKGVAVEYVPNARSA